MATATANQPEASSTFPPSLTWSFSVSGTVTGTWTATLWSAPYYDGTYVQLPVVVGSTQVTGTTTTAGTTVTYGTPTTSYYYQVRVTGGGITGTVTSTPLYFYSPYQGPQGVQGSQGIKGDQGPTGITGPQGHQGLQGLMEIVDFSGQNQVLTSYTDTAHVKPNPTFTFDGTVLALTGNMNASGAFATSAGFTGPTVSTSGLIYSGGFTGPAANTINGIGIDPLSKNVSAVGTLNTSGTIATSAGFTGPTVSASGLIRSGGFTGPAANTINGIGIEPLTKNVSAVGTLNTSGTIATSAGFTGPTVSTSGLIYSGGFTGPAANTINGIGIDPLTKNMSAVGTLNTSGTIATSAGFTGPTVSTSGLIYSGGFTGPAANTINGIGIDPLTKNMSSVGTLNTSGRITSGAGVSVGGTMTGVTTLNASGSIATSAGFTGPTVSTSGLISSGGGLAAGGAITGVSTLNASGSIATSAGFTGPTVSTSGLISSGGGLAAGGAITGVTTLAMSGALSGGTSISNSGNTQSSNFTTPTASSNNIGGVILNASAVTASSINNGSSTLTVSTPTGLNSNSLTVQVGSGTGNAITTPGTIQCGAITSGGALALGANGITSGTHVPAANNLYNLGSVSAGWSTVYGGTFSGNASGLTGSPNITVTALNASTANTTGGYFVNGVQLNTNTLGAENFMVAGAIFSGTLNTSYDGVTWTNQTTSGIGSGIRGVAWNGYLWVAVGASGGSGAVITSPDGVTWTTRTISGTSLIHSVAWNGSLWVCVGGGSSLINTSPDGITWTGRTATGFGASFSTIYGVTWSGSLWVAVGSGGFTTSQISTSPDGITWTSRASISGSGFFAVAWNGVELFAAGQNLSSNLVAYSTDGITWASGTITGGGDTYRSVAWNGSLWIIGGTLGNVYTNTTPAAQTTGWTSRSTGVSGFVGALTWNGSLWVAGGQTSGLATSVDGITWTARTSGAAVSGIGSLASRTRINNYVGSLFTPGIIGSDRIIITEATGTATVPTTANTMPTAPFEGIQVGSLTLKHNNAPGQSSIVFPSATNVGGDYGFITFMDDVSNAVQERARLLIGLHNDLGENGEAVVLMPFGGRVGIGQMNPAYQLDVTGDVRATSSFIGNLNGNAATSSSCSGNAATATTASFANFLNHGTTFNTGNWYNTGEPTPYNRFYFAASGITYINGSGLEFYTAGTPRVVITSTGLGINTTSAAPAYPLDVTGTTRSSNFLSRFYVVNVPTGQIGGIAASNLIGSGAVAGIVRSFCYTTGSGGASNSEIVNASCYDLYVYRQGGAGIWAAQTITTTGGSPVPYWNTTNFTDPYPRYSVSYSNNTGTSQNFYITYQVLSSF
jgi:hypothetical protein